MAIELLFARKTPGKIGVLELDAMISEHQRFSNDVTSFPIESGSFISDHVIQQPEEVTIEGFVTNTPISFLGNLSTQFSDQDTVLNAYLTLLEMFGYKFPNKAFQNNKLISIDQQENKFNVIEIVSDLRLYTDMAPISLDINRNAKTGETLPFTASFRRINTVELQEFAISPSKVDERNPAADRTKTQAPDTKPNGKAGVTEVLESRAFNWSQKLK